ncbi:unnamed protein product, partial [marine sediment metagenome]
LKDPTPPPYVVCRLKNEMMPISGVCLVSV